MPSEAVLKEKKAIVNSIKTTIDDSSIVLMANYRGVTVSELTEIRRAIRPEGGRVEVFKNTLSRLALKDLKLEYPEELLVGPTAIIYTDGDASQLSKQMVKFEKDTKAFELKGGVFENQVINQTLIQSLAKLPSRDELIAKVVGGLKSPLSGFVARLSSPTTGLVNVLRSIKNQKESN